MNQDRVEGKPKTKPRVPEQTFEEIRYLRRLIDNRTPVRVRLSSNEDVPTTITDHLNCKALVEVEKA